MARIRVRPKVPGGIAIGNFYVNYTIHGSDRIAVCDLLRSASRNAFVGPTLDSLTVFFDEASDGQDESVIMDVANRASVELNASVLAVLNHDDDILMYWLYDAGEMIDRYNSFPGYFNDGGRTPAGGNAKTLCGAFGTMDKVDHVDRILRSDGYAFALDRHRDLATLLNHPWAYVCMCYEDIEAGRLANGVTARDLLRIG